MTQFARHVSEERRTLLTLMTAAGVAGLALGSVPFIRSMLPSARARAFGAPVKVNTARIGAGQLETVAWRGKPVWLLRRTPEMIARLPSVNGRLVDPYSRVSTQQPEYARNPTRSLRPDLFVVVGLCTHLGCVPSQRLAAGGESGLDPDWPGGFYCPCHGSKFDLAGRVFKNVPAPTNLVVPPHRYLGQDRVEIGVDTRIS